MKPLFLCVAIFLSFNVLAQSSFVVTGTITDKDSKTPMQAASVFAQNTTIGTVTDNNGNFKLTLPSGGYDLVVTYTGYSTESRRVATNDSTNKNMLIEMKREDRSLEAVAVVSSSEVKDGWERYGLFFLDNFIGKTPFSSNTHILNKDSVKFYFSKRLNRLKVKASTPIQIENDALGYKIKYAIDSFTYNYTTQTTYYTGYPLFEQMQPANDSQRIAWNNNRMKAYKGSMLHFMKSIYTKTLKEQGFEMQFILKNNGTDTAIILKNYYGALNYIKDDSANAVSIRPNQPELAVIYNGVPDSNYLAENTDAPNKYELSILSVTPGAYITIEQNGYYYDQDDLIIDDGYWAWQKVGDMLPYDYVPF
jgi:carboxypeptidase-like protein